MMDKNPEDIFVCCGCTSDQFLAKQIKDEGKTKRCEYCGKRRKSISLSELSEIILSALEENYYLTSSEPSGVDYALAKEGLWDRDGEQIVYVIADLAETSERLAEDVRETISENHSYSYVRDGAEDPYADDAHYAEKGPEDYEFQESWRSFQAEIRSHARFFSRYAREALDSIFEGVDNLATWAGDPVVRIIKPDEEFPIYRARVAFSEEELEKFLEKPDREIGPPPSAFARAGRMNATGIPVFYGALERETCLAEARAPVGSQVVTARFEVLESLRLIDLDVLTNAYGGVKSVFAPNYQHRHAQAAFLRRLVRAFSNPVMPSDEEFEYMPTQAVAEYLADCLGDPLDGMIFHSSQTGGEGRNIVLFNRSCGVRAIPDDPWVKTDISMGWATEEDSDTSITIFEEVQAPPPDEKPDEDENGDWPVPFGLSSNLSQYNENPVVHDGFPAKPSLAIDLESIEVAVIRGVKHDTDRRYVRRIRVNRNEMPF